MILKQLHEEKIMQEEITREKQEQMLKTLLIIQ
jgi:hypothetical protein